MEFVENVCEKEYTEFVINHPKSHFLESYEWGEVSKLRGLIPHYVGLKDNKHLVATALILEKRLPLGYCYYYIPRGYVIDYDNFELISLFTDKIKAYAKKNKCIFFKIDPDIKLHSIDKNAKVIDDGYNNYELVKFLKKIGFHHKKLNLYFENMQPRFTFRLDTTKSIDEIRKGYSKSVLRWIKIANKFGVEVKSVDVEHMDEFVRLMKKTEKRQGFFSHDYNFYSKLFDKFSKIDAVSLLVAYVDVNHILDVINNDLDNCDDSAKKEKLQAQKMKFSKLKKVGQKIPVSSYINVHYGNKSWYLYGANDLDYKDTYANYKLFDFQIQLAHDLGKEIFDEFGTIGDPNSTKPVAGLHEFKKKFGAEYTEFIGEFTYNVRPVLSFIFTKLVVLYRKPGKLMRHIKVKLQKSR